MTCRTCAGIRGWLKRLNPFYRMSRRHMLMITEMHKLKTEIEAVNERLHIRTEISIRNQAENSLARMHMIEAGDQLERRVNTLENALQTEARLRRAGDRRLDLVS